MAQEYLCYYCKAAIAMDDINVAKDVALCRSCGKTFSFSAISGESEVSVNALDSPPRCVKLELDPINGTKLTYRRLAPISLFLIPFTAIWSGGSIYGIYYLQIKEGRFDLRASLFGLPFLFGTIILLVFIAYLLFGKWVITMNQGEGTVFAGVFGIGWTRRFAYDKNSLVALQATNFTINDVPQQGILIRNGETNFVFGASMRQDAKQFIAAVILKHVAAA
jgi:hypothetical protein